MTWEDNNLCDEWSRAGLYTATAKQSVAQILIRKLMKGSLDVCHSPANAQDDPLANKANEFVGVSTVMLNNMKFRVSTFIAPHPFEDDVRAKPISSGFVKQAADALLESSDVCRLSEDVLKAKWQSNKALAKVLTQLETAGRPIVYQQWSEAAFASGFSKSVLKSRFSDPSYEEVAIEINAANWPRIHHCIETALAWGQTGRFGFYVYCVELFPSDVETMGTSYARVYVYPPRESLGNVDGKRRIKTKPEKAKSLWGWLPIPQPVS